MIKKILSGLVCAAVIMSLTGCARSEPSTSTNNSNSEPNQNTSKPTSSMNESEKVSTASEPDKSKPEATDAWADIPYASESDFTIEDVDGGVAVGLYNGYAVKVKIPEKINGKDVVEISSNLFRDSPDIQDVKVPKSVRQIGGGAFEYIEKGYYGAYSSPTPFLKNKRVENPLVIVGDIVVDGTTCHGDVTIPEGVKAISSRAFFRADISNVTIPDSVIEIGTQAFSETPWLKELKSENSLVIVNNILIDVNPIGLDDVTIPDNVIKIGYHAFENCDEILSISLPNSVTEIGNNAFYGCTDLKRVNIPDGVTSIGDFAFCGCSNLAEVTIPDGVSRIGEYIFFDCKNLKGISVPDGVSKIGMCAFKGCSNLEKVTLPADLTEIGRNAFEDCKSLAVVNIPDRVTNLETYTEFVDIGPFNNCTSLKNATYKGVSYDYEHIDWLYDAVNLGESGLLIENGVLTKVSELRDLTDCVIPDGVTEIGDYAFNRRTSLTSVTIPDSVLRIGESAFKKCTNLESVNIPDGVISIGKESFNECTSLTSVTIPDSVTWIGKDAFSGCENLQSITIPGNVSLDRFLFSYNCKNLKSVTINGSMSGSTFDALFPDSFYHENKITVIYKGKTYDYEHRAALSEVINGR